MSNNLVELAKQGNPQAIAALLDRQLQGRGVVVKATRQQDCLKMHLESSKLLKRDPIIAWIRQGLVRLNPEGINRVEVQAWQQDAVTATWSHQLTLRDLPEATADPPSTLELAKQGNTDAIATLLNQALAPNQITAQASINGDHLTVTLESSQVPDRITVEPIVRYQLNRVRSNIFSTVTLAGKKTDEEIIDWTQRLDFNLLPSTPLQTAPKSSAQIDSGSIILLVFSFAIYAILCIIFRFNFIIGIILAFIPATIARNRGEGFIPWYAYSLIAYFISVIHSSFLKGFNSYGLIFFFLGPVLVRSLFGIPLLVNSRVSLTLGIGLLILNGIFAFIPTAIAKTKGRDPINWYIYSLTLFLVALFHSILLKTEILKNVKNKNLDCASFTGQDLTGTNFQNSNLAGANFSNTRLAAVDFKGANLQNANFSGANIWAVNFNNTNLREANFSRTNNRWKGKPGSGIEGIFPWWILVGLGLLFSQVLLWTFFPGVGLNQISSFSGLSWILWLLKSPLLLALGMWLIVIGLTALTLVAGQNNANNAIAILGLIGAASAFGIVLSLLSAASVGISANVFPAAAASLIILVLSILRGIKAFKQKKWMAYCTWFGLVMAMALVALILAIGSRIAYNYFLSGSLEGLDFDRLARAIPGGINWIASIVGVWLVANLAAWGAIAGNLTGILVSKRTTRFHEADLTGANFTQAELANADFRGANVTDVNLTGAKLKGAIAPEGKVFSRGPKTRLT